MTSTPEDREREQKLRDALIKKAAEGGNKGDRGPGEQCAGCPYRSKSNFLRMVGEQ